MGKRSNLSRKRLQELLSYDPSSGVFRWVKTSSNRVKVGSVAGSVGRHGYVIIGIDGVCYRAHHLACLWMDGALPADQVDHVNRVRSDNRWANLRVLGHAGNQRNRRGKQGWFFKAGCPNPYHARIYTGGRRIHLGCYRTAEEAEAAYLKAKARFHPEYEQVAQAA